MKKLLILPAAALAFFMAVPQFAEAKTVQNDYMLVQERVVKYNEITASTLPEAISGSITKDYSGFATDKVYLGDDGTYKVVVSKGDEKKALFYNEKGAFVKAEKKSDKAGNHENPEKSTTPLENKSTSPQENENKEHSAPGEKTL